MNVKKIGIAGIIDNTVGIDKSICQNHFTIKIFRIIGHLNICFKNHLNHRNWTKT